MAANFVASNHGYTHRYVTSLLADKNDPNTVFVGVLNDREWGGVFVSHDGGQHWLQKADGLGGKDVFALKQAPSGAGCRHQSWHVFAGTQCAAQWRPMNVVVIEQHVTTSAQRLAESGHHDDYQKSQLEARVNDLELGSERWLAATTAASTPAPTRARPGRAGRSWDRRISSRVRAEGSTVVAATRSSVMVSHDNGATWKQAGLPSYVVGIRNAAIAPTARS